MAHIEIDGVPDEWTVLRGYFVWQGINEEGERGSGGVEYPFNIDSDPDNHDFDSSATIGMLTVARAVLVENELEMHRDDEED